MSFSRRRSDSIRLGTTLRLTVDDDGTDAVGGPRLYRPFAVPGRIGVRLSVSDCAPG